MSQLGRTALLSDISSNIYTNIQRRIKGDTARDRMQNMVDSTLNIIDDANANGGYMAIDMAGRANVSFLTALAPAGKFLRDDGTWAAMSVFGGGTPGHMPYTNSLNQLDDTPLVYDIGNSKFINSIVTEFTTGTTALYQNSSTGAGFYIGSGDNIDLSSATNGSYIFLNGSEAKIQSLNNAGDYGFIDITPTSVLIQTKSGTVEIDGGSGSSSSRLIMSSNSAIIRGGTTFAGIQEYTDYSLHYTSLSHINKGYADSRYAPIVSGGYLPLSGGTLTGNINGVTPTELNYLSGATSNIQTQINNINAGLRWKDAARVMVDSNVNISSPGSSLDGVSLSPGDRVLLNGQTTASQNGIWVWNGSAVAMTRATDSDTGSEILQATIGIEEGTYADQIWMCSTNGPITIDTTPIAFIKSSNTTYTASNGISLSGNNLTLDNSYFSGDATISGGVISIGSGKVTNTMLAGSITSSKLVGTDIATVGTITAGIWNGTAIDATHGGNGQTSVTTGDILYGSATNTWSKLSAGLTAGAFLRNGGASTAPNWSTLILPNSATANRIPYATSTNTWGESSSLIFNGNTLSINQASPPVVAPVYIEPLATNRDGGWNSAIEIQATASNPFASLFFGNQSGTARYGGIVWTRSTSGNTATSAQATIYVNEPTANNGGIHFLSNGNVGTTGQTEVLFLSAASSKNTISGNGVPLYINAIGSAPNKLGFQNAGSTIAYWGAAANIPFFVYEGGSAANYRRLYFDTNGQLGLNGGNADAVPNSNLHLYGSFVGRASWTTNGSQLRIDAVQTNDTGSAGTRASAVSVSFGRPTFASDTANLITITDAATFYIANSPAAGSNMTLTRTWAMWIAAGNIRLAGNIDFSNDDTGNIVFGSSTGTKIGTSASQKFAFWNATPIVQPTTAVAAGTLVSNGGTTLTDTDTIDGYTLKQFVRAVRNTGLLA